MEFAWDEEKRQSIISEREIDLARVARIFEGAVITEIDDRRDYGETRLISLGMIGEEAFYVVHTNRDGVTRLITAWNGGEHGKKRYQASIAGRHQADG
ncbi:MAG: BrnT family toxin [Devosia sp.]